MRGAIPGIGHGIGGVGDFELHRTDGSCAWFPGDEVDGFIEVFVLVFFLLAEIVGKAGCCHIFDAAADGVRFIE